MSDPFENLENLGEGVTKIIAGGVVLFLLVIFIILGVAFLRGAT